MYAVLENKTDNEKVKLLWKHLRQKTEAHRCFFQEVFDNIMGWFGADCNLTEIISEYKTTQELVEKKTSGAFSDDMEAVDFSIYVLTKEAMFVCSALRECAMHSRKSAMDKIIEDKKKSLIELMLVKKELKHQDDLLKGVSEIVILTADNFEQEVLKGKSPVLVNFGSSFCETCRGIEPMVEQAAREFKGRVKVCKLEMVKYHDIAAGFGVMQSPCLVIFKQGKQIARINDIYSKAQLIEFVNETLKLS